MVVSLLPALVLSQNAVTLCKALSAGSYYLTQSITSGPNNICLTVSVAGGDVFLDGRGYTITMLNGRTGISVSGSSFNFVVQNVNIVGPAISGNAYGINVVANSSTIQNCTITGFEYSIGQTVKYSSIIGNTLVNADNAIYPIPFTGQKTMFISNNTIIGSNGYALSFHNPQIIWSSIIVSFNIFNLSSTPGGVALWSDSNAVLPLQVLNNTFIGGTAAMDGSQGSAVGGTYTGNTINGCSNYGFRLGEAANIIENTFISTSLAVVVVPTYTQPSFSLINNNFYSSISSPTAYPIRCNNCGKITIIGNTFNNGGTMQFSSSQACTIANNTFMNYAGPMGSFTGSAAGSFSFTGNVMQDLDSATTAGLPIWKISGGIPVTFSNNSFARVTVEGCSTSNLLAVVQIQASNLTYNGSIYFYFFYFSKFIIMGY